MAALGDVSEANSPSAGDFGDFNVDIGIIEIATTGGVPPNPPTPSRLPVPAGWSG